MVTSAGEKRVFKTKTFARWAGGLLSDAVLCLAAREVAAGIWDADLGGGVCKKRVAVSGHGKRGSTRVLIAKRSAYSIVFLTGRKKSDAGYDFSLVEVEVARMVAAGFHTLNPDQLDSLVLAGNLEEICDGKDEPK